MCLAGLFSSYAHASVNEPLHHWAYEAIERLVAMGIIDRAMVVPQPYSRTEAVVSVGWAIMSSQGIGRQGSLHWPDLDEDLIGAGLLAGCPSGERVESFTRLS